MLRFIRRVLTAPAIARFPFGVTRLPVAGCRLPLVLLLTVAIGGCAARAGKIADIRDDPGRYEDRQVEVTGRVTSAWSVPLVPYALYKIDDGTAEITVLSERRGSPSRGALVRVRGNVRGVANFGGGSVGLHIQERDRDIVRR